MEQLEVIATHRKTLKHYKTIMTLDAWRTFKKSKDYYYHAYKLGFSQFILEN